MSNERTTPNKKSSDLVTFTIKADGEALSGTLNIRSVTVVKGVNKIPHAKILISDGDVSKEDFEHSNKEEFAPGKEIEITAGYHSEEETIFKGILIGHKIRTKSGKTSILTLECRDKAVKMTVGRKSAYFYDSTDSDVIEQILSNYDTETDVKTTGVKHKELIQFNTTDWDFTIIRAEANGRLVIVNDGKITVAAPKIEKKAALSLIYGNTILEFEAGMDARSQYSAAKGNSWDYSSLEPTQPEGSDAKLEEPGNISGADLAKVTGSEALELRHSGEASEAELKSWADAQLLRSRLAKITGRVVFQGYAKINPGDTLELKGVGDRFNGKVFAATVSHQISNGNWVTEVQFGLSSESFHQKHSDILSPSAGGLIPSIKGLQIGIVSKLEDDPAGEHRVLVKCPIIDNEAEGIWARVATLDAGENRGSFFRPEIGDEVTLGFLNGDPRHAVILGMLHSSTKAAPLKGSDDNHEKGFVSRGQLKLMFNDDVLSVTTETPNGNKITLTDDEGGIIMGDENGNKITMNADGISIESAKDIILKATGDISLAGVNIDSKADAKLTGKGTAGVELTSDATMTVKGSGPTEVSSSAIMTVKGSLVKIN